MANAPIDVVPCKGPLALSNYYASKLNKEPFALDKGEFWNAVNWNFNESANSNSSTLFMNSQLDPDGNLSSILSNDFNSSLVSFMRPITLHPPDVLISNPIYVTLTIASILGNLAMLAVILLTPQFRKPANYLIVNLSFSSIVFLVSVNLRMIENAYHTWEYTTFRCRLLAVIHRIPVPCLSLTTMMISVDRGRVARNPMNCSSTISPAWKSVFIWSFSLLIVLPLAFTRQFDECIPMAYKCAKVVLFGSPTYSFLYGLIYLLSVHVIPGVILIKEAVKTKKIMKFLKLSSVEQIHQQLESASTPLPKIVFPDNRLRLLRNSCWFTTIFLILWLPYGLFQFPLDLPKEILPEILEIYVVFYFRFIRTFGYLQIALNPVILFALSYDLRMYLSRAKCNWGYRFTEHRHISRCNRLDRAIRMAQCQP